MALSSELGSSAKISHRSSHRGVAFLVEALVVLAFLMLAMAVFLQLFAGAELEALRSNNLSQAVLLATNCAEEFSAHPDEMPVTTDEGDFDITCDVTPVAHKAGTLYEATITVRKDDKEVYTLKTSRYVSGAMQTEGSDAA